jgi:hypothetical protein
MSTVDYPVHVNAELDLGVSRWLWLVKWVLAIPHYVVLAFLWVAFAVTSVIAFFGILVTGRYPRALFDFNVGVLRWTWRVAYYAYGALGTDRYPPFTIRDVPDYPAHLTIEYPQHLSRGLVLVKWWLLAIPHYVVLAFFLGGAGYAARAGEHTPYWGSGLIGLLVCVAAVVLAVTGRYPQRIFDLVLGLNRWVLRVAGYVALMTDRYPPFALDQGGHEDGSVALIGGPAPPVPAAEPTTSAPDATAGTASGQDRPSAWTGGRVVSVVLGSLAGLVSFALVLSAVALGVIGAVARDSGGFVTSPTGSLHSAGYAIATQQMVVRSDQPSLPHRLLGDVEVKVTPTGGKTLFVGLAPTVKVNRYLGDARVSVLQRFHRGHAEYTQRGTGRLTVAPAGLPWWTEQTLVRNGTRSLVWAVHNGRWSVVVMNADASRGISADAAVGAELPVLPWIVVGMLLVGVVMGGAAVAMILIPARMVTHDRRTPRVAPTG